MAGDICKITMIIYTTGDCNRPEYPVYRECDIYNEEHTGDEARPAV